MIRKRVSLRHLNTFGFEIYSDFFISIGYEEQLYALWKTNFFERSSPLILGGGSNILFTGDYRGIVVQNCFSGIKTVKEDSEYVWLEAGGGEVWHNLVMHAVSSGLGGIENLSLIPGTCGAAPIQNIGAYGVELKDSLEELRAFDLKLGKTVVIKASECEFGYRDSIFKQSGKGRFFILSITLKLKKNPSLRLEYGDIRQTLESWNIDRPGVADISRAVIHIRQSKLPDPEVIGNCGSFFKNPVVKSHLAEELKLTYPDLKTFTAGENEVKIPAGWLIEKAGWKGFRRGDAGVHEKQALVLVNYGNASGNEVFQLAKDIQADIEEKFSIRLEMEVNVK